VQRSQVDVKEPFVICEFDAWWCSVTGSVHMPEHPTPDVQQYRTSEMELVASLLGSAARIFRRIFVLGGPHIATGYYCGLGTAWDDRGGYHVLNSTTPFNLLTFTLREEWHVRLSMAHRMRFHRFICSA